MIIIKGGLKMYSILLVEDEIIELETLKNYVDWDKIGIDRVYTARGSRSALACVAEHEPDILLSDIQMPGMSGIELAKLIREEGYTCKIVFLTGYDKFEYAKAAIQVHAEDYLLKPFQIEEVERLMLQIVDKIRQERQVECATEAMLGKAFEDLCLGRVEETPSILSTYFQKKQKEDSVLICAFRGIEKEERKLIADYPEVIHSFTTENLYITLIHPQVLIQQFVKRVLDHVGEDIQGIFVDKPVELFDLYSCISSILQSQETLFFGEKRKIYELEEVRQWLISSDTVFKTSRRSIIQAILTGDEDKAVELLRKYLEEYQCAGKGGCLRGAYGLFVYLKDCLQEQIIVNPAMEQLLLDLKEPELLQCATYVDMEERFVKYVVSCCQIFQREKDDYYVDWVKQYVEQNYATDCNVEDMAKIIGLSPNYLRKKFKTGMGFTILEYVTEVRLQKARELLRERRLKVKEVSIQVGYENISYFTQLFAKKNGVTPSEYKNMVH